MKRKRKVTVIKIEVGPPSKGHYNYQGCKTTFDNRPKRLRTRQAIENGWKREV